LGYDISFVLKRFYCYSSITFANTYFGVTTLTYWDHVTSSVTWPTDHSDSAWALPYWWSMMTMRLFCTVI